RAAWCEGTCRAALRRRRIPARSSPLRLGSLYPPTNRSAHVAAHRRTFQRDRAPLLRLSLGQGPDKLDQYWLHRSSSDRLRYGLSELLLFSRHYREILAAATETTGIGKFSPHTRMPGYGRKLCYEGRFHRFRNFAVNRGDSAPAAFSA